MDLTEAMQLLPEQSTAAVIIHHPAAKYFAVRGLTGDANAAETVDPNVGAVRAAAGEISLAEARSDT
jgi:hypothetical protein